jgi:hypothetical protein
MPALGAGIHASKAFNDTDVDGRDRPGHDDGWVEIQSRRYALIARSDAQAGDMAPGTVHPTTAMARQEREGRGKTE